MKSQAGRREMDALTVDKAVPGSPAEPDDDYDGPLLPFADFMNMLGEHNGVVMGVAEQGTAVRLTVTEFAFDLPLELRVRRNKVGDLILRSGPPTQRVATTVFPVLHRLQVRLARTVEAGHVDEPSAG
jgi:hypothetical protein